uniref:Succinate dehydrogenase [ubiquinone] cytochrome b small subunit n=1 Tax=Pseudodiaptomus poplesia TaxID=213370 RepID=A0A0U2V6S0_9MAXI|nr:succinate dehydrogenase [Pseudodiaptomus poplesia]
MLSLRLAQSCRLARTSLRPGCVFGQSSLRPTAVTAFSTSHPRKSEDHVRMWSAERAVSVAQIPCFIVPFIYTNPVTDALFCTLLALHSHWGIEAIAVDYIRPSLFNGSTVIPTLAVALVWAMSAFTLGALYYFNYTDVGIVNAIKMLWRL